MKSANFKALPIDSVYGSTEWLNEQQNVSITPGTNCLFMKTKSDTYILNCNANQPTSYFAVVDQEMCLEFCTISNQLSWYEN